MSTDLEQDIDKSPDTLEAELLPLTLPANEQAAAEQANELAAEQAAQQTAGQAAGQAVAQQAGQAVKQQAAGQAAQQQAGQAVAQQSQTEIALPPGFEPIPQEKLVKAKRTKRLLITMIILLLLILFGGIAGGLYYYINFGQPHATFVPEPIVIENDENVLEDGGTIATMEMPNLTQMFGRTADEVVALLGDDYTITAYSEVPASSGTAASSGSSEATDTAAVIREIVTISYSPETQDSSLALRQSQKIYLSLGEEGTTLEVYFVSSMDILDFPWTNFANLVATSDSFVQTLGWSGVSIVEDTPYTAPTPEEFTEYVDPSAQYKKIKKETTTWAGALISETAPTSFEITYTFDYGASGVEDIPERNPIARVLYLKLS